MKNHPLIALSLLGLLLGTGCAATWDKPATQRTPVRLHQPIPPLEARDKVTATAIVQAVNLENRQLVLRGKGDSIHTLAVSEEVRNLPQIKSGDRIELTYYESLALALEKSATDSAARRGATGGIERGEAGRQPASVAREDVEIVADIARIQQKTRRVTLRSTESVVTLKVPKTIDIRKFKVGDRVRANYVPAVAVAVQPVAIKPAKSAKAR